PCAILRTRIHTHGPFEFRGVLRLVDMPMEPEDRLSFKDRGTKSRAADRNQDLLSSPHNRAWRVRGRVELRGDVQPGLIGWVVQEVDGQSEIFHPEEEGIAKSLELLLR